MVSGCEYCTFSAFSTMVRRLPLDHLDHYLNKVASDIFVVGAQEGRGLIMIF